MRALFEIAAAAALVAIAWTRPFNELVGAPVQETLVGTKIAPVRAQASAPAPESSPAGAWMWDPERKGPLDRPAYNQTRTLTGHVYYLDAQGRQYWIDGQGRRHYDR